MIVLIAIAMLLVDGRRGVGDDGLDAADVVGEAALDLAGLRLGEEPQRHPLEVARRAPSRRSCMTFWPMTLLR